MILRKYQPSDCETILSLFYNTVHNINKKDYSKKQLNAWANKNINLKTLNSSLLSNYTIVAEIDGLIVGFGDITKTGYLDHLYVHHNYQNQKIATKICDELEKNTNSKKIITHSSITALGFFKKRGYTLIKEQQVKRNDVFLTNYVMELIL